MNDGGDGLQSQVDVAQWDWLRAHNERGALVLVDSMLDLAEVGERVAADDLETIQAWQANGLLTKPVLAQIEAWNNEPKRRFSMLVVSPYVLFQDMLQ